jgi:chorismate mutase
VIDMTHDDDTPGGGAGAESGGGAEVEEWWRDPADVARRIDALRDEIDRLDEELVRLLSARARCALTIGALKKHLQMEIYQPTREEAVLRHVRGVNPGPLDAEAIARLFERIIDEARRLERIVQAPDREPGE